MATPLPCNTNFIQFVGTPTQWYNIDLLTGEAVLYGNLNPQDYVNAIGFNPLDQFIYGYDLTVNQIVQVDADRNITYMGLPQGLPANGYNTGCFDKNGFFYIMLNGAARFYTIDLRPGSSSYMMLVNPLNNYTPQSSNYGTAINNGTMNVSDWDCDNNGFLYGIQPNGIMQRLNLSNGNVISMTTTGPSPNASFGAVAIDYDGYIYAIENNDGKVFRYTINGTIATAEYFSNTYFASQNDGCMCRNAQFLIDFGDAPDLGAGNGPGNYNTLLENNGPRHQMLSNLFLGTQVTAENDAYQNADATGDDLIEGIQDDGLAVPLPNLSISATSYSLDVTVSNDTDQTAYLYGWVDFNANGLFEPDEIGQIISVPPMPSPQVFSMEFTIPDSRVLVAGQTFARLRLTTDILSTGGDDTGQDIASISSASDGEVEDYILNIMPIADLMITKTADSDTVLPRDTITYTLTVTNNGPDTAEAPMLVDNIYGELDNVLYSTDNGASWNSWSGSITLPDLEAGNTAAVLIEGIVNLYAGGNFENTASVSSLTQDPDSSNNADTIETTVLENANISVVKSASPQDVSTGDIVTYTLLVSNAGPSDAENVTLSDDVPTDITDAEYSLDNGTTWVPWSSPYSLGTLANGDVVSILLRGTVSPTASTTITNTATVGSDTPDIDLSDNTSTIEVSVSESPPAPLSADLAVIKSASPSTVLAGTPLTYKIQITNNGPSNAMGVVLADAIPASVLNPLFSLDGGTTWLPWIGTYPIQDPSTGMIAVGQTITVLIRGTVSPAQTRPIRNTATVVSATPDPDLSNNSSTAFTPTTSSADIAVLKTASPNPVDTGAILTYTLTITNFGPSFAQNVTISDEIPAGLTDVVYSIDAGNTWVPWSGSYNIGTMAAGAVITVIAQGAVLQGTTGAISNTVTVTSTTDDPDTTNNTSIALTDVADSADISVIKTTNTSVATAGEMLIYTLTVGNAGPSDAENVVVSDNIGPYLLNPEYAIDNSGVWQPWLSPYTIALLESGDSIAINIKGIISSDTIGTIRNTSVVQTDTYDPDMSNNRSTIRLSVNTFADLSISKTGDLSPLMAGDSLTYTIEITNAGPSDARNLTITDTVPEEIENPQFSTDNGATWQDWSGSYSINALPMGNSTEILIRGTVPVSATGTIINTATVESNTPDPDMSNNSTMQLTPITTVADLSIAKMTSQMSVSVGDTINYALAVQNAGPDDAQNVMIADVAPASLENVSFSVDGGATWQVWSGTYSIGLLENGALFTILIRGAVSAGAQGSIVNTAFVSSTTLDPNVSNNYSFAISKAPCPSSETPLTKEDALNQIVSSIAMEELALSHILNAEGEKIQYVLGTLQGISGPNASVEDVLRVNKAVQKMLSEVNQYEMLLNNKLKTAIKAYREI